MTLFEMKEKMFALENERKGIADWLAEKACDPTVSMDEIKSKQAKMEEVDARYAIMKDAHDAEDKAQRDAIAMRNVGGTGTGMTEKAAKIKAKADFYKKAFSGKSYEGLGAVPASTADLGYGENLLPTNMATELLTEPVEENSLRQIEPVTQITGLEEPKLLFTITDESLADVTDQGTAKEIEMEGDTVSYGRFKTKIKATVKDTVMHGTEADLVGTIESALRSGLAVKEKMRAFAPASGGGAYDSAHKHMSFYAETEGVTDIKTVEGMDIIDAIVKAWADLPEVFATNAKCVMRKQDYYAAVRTLANESNDLWGKKPEDVIGIPVIFNDRAVVPVIGDFRYSKQNYDIGTTYDTDKDVDAGEYYFVLTAWGDHQIRLKSAFRLAVVAENP